LNASFFKVSGQPLYNALGPRILRSPVRVAPDAEPTLRHFAAPRARLTRCWATSRRTQVTATALPRCTRAWLRAAAAKPTSPSQGRRPQDPHPPAVKTWTRKEWQIIFCTCSSP
jgi:hypothetical protein